MPGPLPKDQAIRQRRNKPASRAILGPESAKRKRNPPLPKLPAADGQERDWHPLTLQWWRDVWHSPMASEYAQADIHGLYRLAVLVDLFWLEPSEKLAAEIRLEQQAYGLSPTDRKRLQWEIAHEQPEAARTEPVKSPPASEDPRLILLK